MPSNPRVALLARDLVWADRSGGSLPFSYAARKLQASLAALGEVECTVIDLRDGDEEAFLERIQGFSPTLIGASTYIWSVELFCRLAKRVKQWAPGVPFVMGGPAARPSLLGLPPYAPFLWHVDAVAKGEAEQVLRDLALEHRTPGWQQRVAGLSVPGALGWRRTEPAPRPVLDDYPSPYQIDLVPPSEVGFLETFRGCPISCAFCQWGEERADRVHSAEYLAEHLRGLARAGVRSVYVTDAGFNLSARAFRNLVEAERRTGVLAGCQVLGHIYPTFIRDEHLEFFQAFRRAEITVGIQSFDEAVLKRLGRPFDMSRFQRVIEEMALRFDLDLELIVGLPGDDPANFRRTFERALDLGTSVRVFHCLALPDALLDRAAEFEVDFDPRTFMVRSTVGWSRESLQAEWDHVREVASQRYRPNLGPNWVDFRPRRPDQPAGVTVTVLAPELLGRLRDAVAGVALGWHLAGARADGARLLLDLDGDAGRVVLEARRAGNGAPALSAHGGVAYSHRGALGASVASRLKELIEHVHPTIAPAVPAPLREGVAG